MDHTGDLAAQVREIAPEGVDVALHFAGAPDVVAPLVKAGGVFVSTMLRSPDDVSAEGIQVASIYANPAPETLERIARNQAEQHTRVTIQRVYDLDQASDAFAGFAAGTVGKLVVSLA